VVGAGEPERIPSVEQFVDERGHALRVSWHEDEGVAVASIWRDDQCVATVRLRDDDLMRLSAVLTQAWLDSTSRATRS